MKMSNRQAWNLITSTIGSWTTDYAPSMGAAIAFYTLFSVAPLLLIVIAVGGYFFGPDAMQAEVYSLLSALVGDNGARGVEKLVGNVAEPSQRSWAAGIGVATFLFGATSVFNELQDALNRIWRAHARPRVSGFLPFIRQRLLSFAMIAGLSLLLMASLVVSVALSALGKSWATSADQEFLVHLLSSVLSFVLMTATFALIYKLVPQAKVRWHDVWIGAATTSVLFTGGKLLIGIYLRRSRAESAFGALSSLAVCLLWVYYSAQIFLLGAEFTWNYSKTRAGGGPPVPQGEPTAPARHPTPGDVPRAGIR
jgi:membrane protein